MKHNNIRWAAIQPLTGGMYLGAEEAIGHPAEFILSYKGLDVAKEKDGKLTSVANEYNLLKYLKKHNRCPKYYQFKKDMFDFDLTNQTPEIYLKDNLETPNYDNLDIVVAVPVCSGLSMATSGSNETKECRNNNMLFITNYTLNVIKPKCYIFENAPTLMGSRGEELRKQLEQIALYAKYSLLYYKTNTSLHENCQNRPRTFIIFTKHNEDKQKPCVFDFEDKHINVKDFFKSISDNLEQSEPIESSFHNYMLIDYINDKLGKNWKEVIINSSLMKYIEDNKLFDDFLKFVFESDKYVQENKDKVKKYIEHIKYKRSIGKNYYANDVCNYSGDFWPSVMFRSIRNMIHPFTNEICSIRDNLSLMGMPEDFILYGDESNLPKIGQNVPVKTAKFIVEQAIKNLNKSELDNSCNCIYQDNIKGTIEIVA